MEPIESKSIVEELKRHNRNFDVDHPVLATRWLVEEYRPAGDHYNEGRWESEIVHLSVPFNTEEDANDYRDKHKPSNTYYKLRIRKEHLREYKYRKWS